MTRYGSRITFKLPWKDESRGLGQVRQLKVAKNALPGLDEMSIERRRGQVILTIPIKDAPAAVAA